ncbi:ArnT family glycosyltransferase [uncultured Sphingomonas sp.]|uniref:ArnT family glycosyltransferase n=1 Tax=uncultured Sphingomonas sp. TaxID=158754 RepID=UPI0035CAD31E
MTAARRHWLLLAALALVLCALALVRPVDHDESQYVAAAVLSAHRLLPYRDYAYLQTPLQPLAFAPVAALAGSWAWPALRIADALLGAAAIGFVHAGARAAGVRSGVALAVAGLMACSEPLLFGAGTARNDALPLACLSAALWLAMKQEDAATRQRALGIGLLLGAAAATKVSYLLPLLAYLGAARVDRRRLPSVVGAGVLPAAGLVASVVWSAPAEAWLGIWTFPHDAPGLWYGAGSWRMSLAGKAVDLAKFLALGPALLALVIVAPKIVARGPVGSRERLLAAMLAACLLAAIAPAPTMRQYLVPVLPPLFLLLALAWEARPPASAWRIGAIVFAVAGLAPSVAALVDAAGAGPAMARAMHDGAAIRTAMDRTQVVQTVVTLSPQYLPATYRLPDPRFATGPFYFRTRNLIDPAAEARAHLVSLARIDAGLAIRPEGILTGGGVGDAPLEAALAQWATAHGYRRTPVPGTAFSLYVRPR